MRNFLLKIGIINLTLTGMILSGCRHPQTSDPAMVMAKPGLTPVVQSGRSLADLSILKNSREKLNVSVDSITISETSELYRLSTEGIVRQRPVTLEDGIVIGDEKGYIYKVSLKGDLLWKEKLKEPDTSLAKSGFQGSGTVGDGLVIIAAADGEIFGISPDSGLVVWKNKVLEDTDLALLGDLIYYDGLAYAGVSLINSKLSKSDSLKSNIKDQQKYNKIIAFEPATGDVVWKKALPFPQGNMQLTEALAIDPKAKMLYFTASNSYDSLSVEVVAGGLDLKSGEVIWLSNFPVGGKDTYVSSPVLFERSQNGKTVRLMGAMTSTGKHLIWERNKGVNLTSEIITGENGSQKDSIGINLTDLKTFSLNKSTAYRVGTYIFRTDEKGQVICQSELNNKVEWQSSPLGNFTSPIWYHNGYLYLSVFNETDLKPELIVFQLGIVEEPYFIRILEDK